MRVTKQDSLVRNGARSGALGGIRTHDTWFRRPIRLMSIGHDKPRLVPFRTCGEASIRPFVTSVPKQYQRSHGQQMAKSPPTESGR